MVTLYNKTEAVQDKSKQESAENISHAIALAELLAYIDEARKDKSITVFKLADLCKLYSTHFKQLGGEQHDHLHSTRLKNRILAHFPDLTAHKEGHGILLAFNNDLGAALHRSSDHDYDDKAIVYQERQTLYEETC